MNSPSEQEPTPDFPNDPLKDPNVVELVGDLRRELSRLRAERDDLKQSLQVLTNSEQMWMEKCSDAQTRLVSTEAERDEALKFNEQFSYDNLVASLTALQVAGMGQSGPNTLLAMVKECVARLAAVEKERDTLRAVFGHHEDARLTRIGWLDTLLKELRQNSNAFIELAQEDPDAFLECLSHCDAIVRDAKPFIKNESTY